MKIKEINGLMEWKKRIKTNENVIIEITWEKRTEMKDVKEKEVNELLKLMKFDIVNEINEFIDVTQINNNSKSNEFIKLMKLMNSTILLK